MINKITTHIISSSLLNASEEMGIALRNASYSPNIKERMDHSAAIFDDKCRLLAQAEHIPVHLGSLPWGLRNIVSYCDKNGMPFEPTCMVAANNPYITGTHLNDVTVVAPVFFNGRLVGFVVNKAHHSDVGGQVPGSISMRSRNIFEEGSVVDPVYLIRHNDFFTESLDLFSSSSRTPNERIGDLKAQAAANVIGSRRFREIVAKYGLATFNSSIAESFSYTARFASHRLSSLREGRYYSEDFLEHPDGHDIKLAVTVEVNESSIVFDYEGTDSQVDLPLNTVMGVTISGVYFVMRSIMGDDFPANEGTFSCISVRVPPGTLLNATFPHPVGGGNVETSQRNADLLFRALSKAAPALVPAACGGSMNNVMMGGEHRGRKWAFYETIGVGLGGRNGMDGIDGIQANMTNTMNTPVEEIERSLPILLTRYEFRKDSSGAGKFRGGTGLIRGYKVLSPATFTIVAERERHRPWGLAGGKPGSPTRIYLLRRGKRVRIPSKCTVELDTGDEILVCTAGGGGFGDPRSRNMTAIFRDLDGGIITPLFAKHHYNLE